MDIKWLEDLVALGQAGSLSLAARQRHVTEPAFGRRIQALEAWAGQALVDRRRKPVALTPAGLRLMEQAEGILRNLQDARHEMHSLGQSRQGLRLATGRTLARTWVADWLVRISAQVQPEWMQIRTGSLAETLAWLESEQADLLVAYHHPAMALRPQGRGLLQKVLAQDQLVPVTRRRLDTRKSQRATPDRPMPWLAYAPSLALAGLVEDHLKRCPSPAPLKRVLECDSADALLEYAIKGLGMCWLPWSLAAGACRQGLLEVCWDPSMVIAFEVRLVRRRNRLSDVAERIWLATAEK
jgi:DNA-binding transcriptional LysR family regulator